MNENTTPKNLTPKQQKAIESLLLKGEVKAAADHAGVNRSTLYRWMAEDEFKKVLREAEAAALESLSRELTALAQEATSTIKGVMADPLSGGHVRLRAAEIVLANLLKLRELVTLEERISQLEKRLE